MTDTWKDPEEEIAFSNAIDIKKKLEKIPLSKFKAGDLELLMKVFDDGVSTLGNAYYVGEMKKLLRRVSKA